MKHLSQTLTMALLLGTTLNAAALQLTDGNMTPRSAAKVWIAEKAEGKNPTTIPYKIHQGLKAAAEAARNANNPERVLELLQAQQNFMKESQGKPETRDTIYEWHVHQTFSSALEKETNSVRIVSVYVSWTEFTKTNPIDSYAGFKRPDSFKTKYEAAQKEAEASRSLIPAVGLVAGDTASASEITVAYLVGAYGQRNIDKSSLLALKASFLKYYKAAVLRLHPDKSPDDAAEFKLLQAHKAWVDELTEAAFTVSPK